MPKQRDRTVPTSSVKSLPSGTSWSYRHLSSFFLFHSSCKEQDGRGTNHSPATVILPMRGTQPHRLHAAAIPPHLQRAHFHSCIQQTQALPPLLLLSNQGLLADFSPTRKRLKEENPYRLSFQAGRTSEFSAVTGFMVNRHATVSTKVSVTPCWSSGQVDLC